jgi:hypothetical protein
MSDLINLIERVIQNEHAIKDLRKELAAVRKEASDGIEEVQQEYASRIPAVSKDGKGLVFETYDGTSDRVFATVPANVSSDEPETLA